MSSVNPPLKWHGGKHYLARKFVALMPRHLHYVEPYFGGGAVLLARDTEDSSLWLPPHQGVSEVVNDINGRLVNFWRVLQDPRTFEQFRRIVEAIPVSRVEWAKAHAHHHDEKDRVADAVAFFVDCRQSRSGLMKGFTPVTRTRTRRRMNGNVSEWLTAVSGLAEVHRRLMRVVVENMPALDLIRREDTPGTLFYCLPPGELVRTEDERLIPIESVEPGTVLFGGRTVKARLSRRFSGELLTVRAQGLPRPLRVTADHRIVCIPGKTARQERRADGELWDARRVIPAGECRVGDYLLVPLGGKSERPLLRIDRRNCKNGKRKPVSFSHCPEVYRLIGYYAAEGRPQAIDAGFRGSRGYRPNSAFLRFGVHEEETWVRDAAACVDRVFGIQSGLRDNGAGALQVQIFSTTVARALSRWVPGTARTRRMHQSLMAAPVEFQRELLIGWLRGDGGLSDDESGRAKLLGTSVSFELCEQMYRIALRCGLRPSYKFRAGSHDLYFASEDAEFLGWQVRARRFCSTRRIVNGHVLVRIRNIAAIGYSGPVYDLDVDGDDLYAAPYLLVHNCDPPYLHETRESTEAYAHEMDEKDHRELLEVLRSCKGKVMLSGYPSALYDAALAGWSRHTFDLPNHVASGKRKERETEVLWCNF